MRIPHSAIPRLRLLTVVGFFSACVLLFGYLWVNMGGTIPVVSSKGYRLTFETRDVDNLVYDSDVMVAGVRVGKVRELSQSHGVAKVVVQVDDDGAFPLHEGTAVHLRSKSLIEETYVDLVDGDGSELPSGAELPQSAVVKSVQLDDVLNGLDASTRKDLGVALRSLGDSTNGTRGHVDRTLTGLGSLGREGHDVLDALDAQSEDLHKLVRSTTQMMKALDTGQGRIVDLVGQARLVTATTTAHRGKIEETMTVLPRVLDSAGAATRDLTSLSRDLRPITTSLLRAAPDLNRALVELPATTRDLRGLLPSLSKTLDRAPATLTRVPRFSGTTSSIVPEVRATLSDVNPMLAYMSPYGHDLVTLFTNWGASLANSDGNGHFIRIFPVFNEQSLKASPVNLNVGPFKKSNAYPRPGGALDPQNFTGTYPRLTPDPK